MHLQLLVSMCALLGADPAPAPQTDIAVSRAIRFLEQDMVRWKADRNCAACHHAPMMIWSLNEARRAGYPVNEPYLEEITQWTLTHPQARVFPEASKPGDEPPKLALSTIYLALGLNALPKWDDTSRESWNRVVTHLRNTQNADGSWTGPAGRAPVFDRSEAITLLALFALKAPAAEVTELVDISAIRLKARERIEVLPRETTHQELALRLLVTAGERRDSREIEVLANRLRDSQNVDGSWSQTAAMPGDAYATGQSMYALLLSGADPNEASVRRAADFLAKSQQPDGSWPMVSRPDRPDGRPARNLNPITYAGASWATLGLVRARKR